MAKYGHSNFFLTIFPKKTGINLEWPKIAVQNFFWQFFPKRMVLIKAKDEYSKFIQTFLVQKDWKKFGMVKNGHSEFI